MNPDFGLYQLGAEHEALRETVRALAGKEIAPYAAAVDELERFPHEAHAALVRARTTSSGHSAPTAATRCGKRPRPASASAFSWATPTVRSPADAHVSRSIFRFDREALVCEHIADRLGYGSLTYHLRRLHDDGPFDQYITHLEHLCRPRR